jgi:hypothetical protein
MSSLQQQAESGKQDQVIGSARQERNGHFQGMYRPNFFNIKDASDKMQHHRYGAERVI